MRLREPVNHLLDHFVRPQIAIRGRLWATFHLCGMIGLASAIALSMILVTGRELSPWIMAGIVSVAVATFLGLALLTKMATGEERIVCYHHQMAVLVTTAVFLRLLDQPVLPYLEITMLGVGLFIACGRIGCLMNGCCHGRPHPWGVCYPQAYQAVGFTRYLVGVRLFPIKASESLWLFFLVAAGSALVLLGRPSGEALTDYIAGYSAARFFFEFMRGDPERPYYGGLSEPQWTSVIASVALAALELSQVLPLQRWHVGAAVLMIGAVVVILINKGLRRTMGYQILQSRHIREVAQILEQATGLTDTEAAASGHETTPAELRVGTTSLGIRISSGRIANDADHRTHYTFSQQNQVMTKETARTLAGLILQLRRSPGPAEIVQGSPGIYHLVVRRDCSQAL